MVLNTQIVQSLVDINVNDSSGIKTEDSQPVLFLALELHDLSIWNTPDDR